MGMPCRTYVRRQKYSKDLVGEPEGRKSVECVGVQGRIILKLMLRRLDERGLD
jgi:hypothetical protein